eukprot:TRINITY_DN38542_c0_g1_i1.p1 TRINITY_DN38542_c0_g1~~TRINITY_DN38542_c0_g1_i1.p1  ORF type:complete len:144 (+),score=58.84 TRINITY_DN38542_c0_g1_i1:45-476(+)
MSGLFFFFFKQKTAYEMLRSLVGSEMCIRDRVETVLDSEAICVKADFVRESRVTRDRFDKLLLLAVDPDSGNCFQIPVVPEFDQNAIVMPKDSLPLSAFETCLLYTSDAADEEDSVDLGGRRIIKKKKNKKIIEDYKYSKDDK